MGKYRYLTLKCKATIGIENGLAKVTILDDDVNPLRQGLYFEDPLDSLQIISSVGDEHEIEMVAAFNKEWFNYHVLVEKFKFKDVTNGTVITDFIQLDPPKMDPVKPKP